ncbi:SH3 domain-containing kinase-binding protein 1 isoform X2 [Macaca thibetana thibetana]|uniref:SH3 domain-containing kinase-binding protein 1 n=5 Tax=Cercopithecinae TaxID=9528 RepID=F6SU56_MACMU|nr:SH3 domain-containing kinase-binding protein 1 isoform X7 [Macaca fascicularis]XP_014982530.1 SH3 domain-containing kinase-binding protein 1 isoform X5 [Macaca mulatta]XP_017809420.2 SH3 domain-containing kinase-binding protein 1 isoform X6 [Papio anubis]XP_025228011.1 SH3 domain-containing kinase-binding protein 1 isoform X3 [Theropithecus gelada]XP_050632582.1 SH3 domain-containing kinase-binding protein 1 isoform X2 [Macaca thibetana thibetana]
MVEAIVEFDYQAQHDDELTISVGEIITNIRKEDGGWWEGQINGRRGLFPDNFVREIKKEMKKDPLANKAPEKPLHEVPSGNSLLSSETILRTNKRGERRRRRCQVAFSYLPQNDDELELKVGDIIEVVGEVEEGWWEGVLNGKTGMFPSNFIKELSGESDELGISQDEQLSKSSLRETTGSESDGGDSSSTKSEGANGTVATAAIQPKKVKGVGFGDIFKDKPIKLRPRSIEVENDFLPVEKTIGKKLPATTATPDSSKTEMDSRTKSKDYCKVIFPYEAQNDDELTIKEGDIVTLINKDCIDVGWWEGELNGRRGVFPDNFVKLLPSDFEKEGNRPKKPPPPSAPVIKQGAGTTERKHEIKKIPPERPEMLPNRTEEKERPEREPKLDLQKPSVPAIPPKKPRPPKTNSLSRPGALPPRRPERPVGPLTHTRGDGPKIDLAGSSLSGILDKDLSDRSNDIDLEGFDSVVSSTEKLSHPTTSRPKATGRRPPSQSLTSSSLSSPDIFDSPSPEEDKEEHISLAHRGVDASKKTSKTVTISQVSDNKASLLPKPGTMAAGGGGPAPLSSAVPSPLSSSLGTAGHRANSPSLFGTEGKPKMEPAASSQAAVEELRTQVRELRSIIETMKDQQKREIKQLLSELDEEKKIRLRLQMEVNDIKKALQSK